LVVPGVSYPQAATELKGGDANNSGRITVADISCVSGDFGGPPSFCGPLPASSDITGDGLVGIGDLSITGGNYQLASPRPW
jgi:hypothetical protein